MLWQEISNQIASKLSGNAALINERPFIYINTSEQCLHHVDIEPEFTQRYSISTAVAGVGNRNDSHKTPSGIHRIKQKIGAGEALGTVFKGRLPIGRITSQTDNQDDDEITTRILWLDGMEPDINLGGVDDTFARYIYIHGTSDEMRIGQAVSHGCIRMKNLEVIKLFDDVLINDLVLIK
jgi:hypothetical protein